MNNLNFGQAIEALKEGKLVQRTGWNGKGMFLFMRPADELTMEFIPNVRSLPESVKKWLENNITPDNTPSGKIAFNAYICMKAADGSVVNGWLASQTDMLSEDWCILE